jgi:hypothetical protein
MYIFSDYLARSNGKKKQSLTFEVSALALANVGTGVG